MKVNELVEKKRESLHYFVSQLMNAETRKYIGKIFLFGSVVSGQVREESDIDLLILCFDKTDLVLDKCIDLQMETYYRYSESVEPLIYPIEIARNPDSYFLYRVTRYGEEVYGMEENELKRHEAENYLTLACEYLEGAKENLKSKRFRIAIDTGYNAAELAAKALLLLEVDEIPSSHGGVVGEFGKLYVKTGRIEREIGRGLNKALDLRNKARYVYNTEISTIEAEEIIKLSSKMIQIATDYLEKAG